MNRIKTKRRPRKGFVLIKDTYEINLRAVQRLSYAADDYGMTAREFLKLMYSYQGMRYVGDVLKCSVSVVRKLLKAYGVRVKQQGRPHSLKHYPKKSTGEGR